MARVAWVIEAPVEGVSYSFEINPLSGGAFSRGRHYAKTSNLRGDPIVQQGHATPRTTQAEGIARSLNQKNALYYYRDFQRQLRLTDDLGRVTWVVITGLGFKPEPRRQAPHRAIFTLSLTEVNVP